MNRCSRTAMFATLLSLCCALSVQAETLRCQSLNGNVNCAGPGAVSCQTINGKKVCTSGHGDVVQSFGNGASSDQDQDAADEGLDDVPSGRANELWLQQRGPRGRSMTLYRNGTELHLHTDKLSIDRN